MQIVFGFLLFLLSSLSASALAADGYRDLGPSKEAPPARVTEFFWYGCPHCYRFDPMLEAWRAQHPDIDFVRQPAVYGKHWSREAKLFHTAELLGIGDKIHNALFDLLQKYHGKVDDKKLEALFAEYGIDPETFNNTLHSFAVDLKTRQDDAITARFQVTEVPALLVDGRYLITPKTAGGLAKMLAVLDRLLADSKR